METAMLMIPLSRVLNYGANRWANIAAGILHTAAVAASLFVPGTTPASYYLFFAVIEIVTTLGIVRCAWKWRSPEAK
jgi:hypothetical protein